MFKYTFTQIIIYTQKNIQSKIYYIYIYVYTFVLNKYTHIDITYVCSRFKYIYI